MLSKKHAFQFTCGSVSGFLLYKFLSSLAKMEQEKPPASMVPSSSSSDSLADPSAASSSSALSLRRHLLYNRTIKDANAFRFEQLQDLLYHHHQFRRILTCSSPGKVIITGEHAVVYGKKAISTAINKRTFVSLYLPKNIGDSGGSGGGGGGGGGGMTHHNPNDQPDSNPKTNSSGNSNNNNNNNNNNPPNFIAVSIYLRFSNIKCNVTFRWKTEEILEFFTTHITHEEEKEKEKAKERKNKNENIEKEKEKEEKEEDEKKKKNNDNNNNNNNNKKDKWSLRLETLGKIQKIIQQDKSCILVNPEWSFANHKFIRHEYEYESSEHESIHMYDETKSKNFICNLQFDSFFSVFWLLFYQFCIMGGDEHQEEEEDNDANGSSNGDDPDYGRRRRGHSIIDQYQSMLIEIQSYIPISSGLGSSAALSSSLCAAFQKLNSNSTFANINVQKKLHPPQGLPTKQKKVPAKSPKEADRNVESSLDKLQWTTQELNNICKWSYECEKICHGTPSGIDNTTSVFGQVIQFKTRQDFKVLSLSPKYRHQNAKLLVIYTGKRGSTKELVQHVRKTYEQYESIVNHILDAIELIGEEMVNVWCSNDSDLDKNKNIEITDNDNDNDNDNEEINIPKQENITEKMRQLFSLNHGLLCALGVGDHKISEIEAIISRNYGKNNNGLKITGAGGGGCLIIPWSESDFQLQLPTNNNSNNWMKKVKSELKEKGYDCFEVETGQYGTQCNYYTCA